MDISDAKTIVQEVFEATGQKIELDDPLVAAALVNSKVQTRAAERAVGLIGEAAAAAAQDLAAATRAEREAAAGASERMAAAVADIQRAIAAGGDNELSRLRAQFADAASSVLRDVAAECRVAAPERWKWRVATAMLGVAVLFAAAGGVIGATLFGHKADLSQEDARALAAGRDFLASLPKLDSATRGKVLNQMAESHEGS